MARPKSEDKRQAILSAAIRVFAERGLNASPTSAISKAAGIAEGTLFTYFPTKDELVNALYREIKLELADALMSGLPGGGGNVRRRLEHLWRRYVDWGVENPEKRKVLGQLQVFEGLTADSRSAGYRPYAAIETMTREAIAAKILHDYPVEFIAATFGRLAETTMDFISTDAPRAEVYRKAGVEMFWSAIARR